MDYYLLVSRRHNQHWTAESVPLTSSWLDTCDRIKDLELQRPGCEVGAIMAHSEHELEMKWGLLQAGGSITVFTYERSPEDRKRLQMEMSDAEPQDKLYTYQPLTHYLPAPTLKAWVALQARVTRGELGGPKDGNTENEWTEPLHSERRHPEEPAA
jgi:hypothetical protein